MPDHISSAATSSEHYTYKKKKKDLKKLEQVQRKAVTIMRVLETKPFAKILKEVGIFSLEKNNFCVCVWNVVVLFKYLKRYHIDRRSKPVLSCSRLQKVQKRI